MLSIALVAYIWWQFWRGCLIQCNCDNKAVVTILNLGAARIGNYPICFSACFFCSQYLLSRNQMALLFSYNSLVDSEATLVPLEWPALLLDPELVGDLNTGPAVLSLSAECNYWLPQPSTPMNFRLTLLLNIWSSCKN